MNRQEIISAIRNLGMSQGFYSRFYATITDGSDNAEEILNELESQHFKDVVDMVMWLEG